MTPLRANHVGTVATIASILIASATAVPDAQRRNRGDHSVHGMPVATNTIVRTPDRYYGQLVTVSAAVDEVLSPTVFVVDQRRVYRNASAAFLGVAGAKEVQSVGAPILVIAPNLKSALEPNRYFLVRGTVLTFDAGAVAKAAAGYTLDVPPAVAAKYQGHPVMVATSIIDSKYAELVVAER